MIVIKKYNKENYSDLIKSGYPFGSYLEPDIRSWLLNFFLDQREIGKFVLKTFFLNEEDAKLVALSSEDRKAVGVVVLRKITGELWGIWDIFVSPPYRGRGISSLLYKESFRFLKQKKVRKVTGIVSLKNVASVKSIERNWQGFLPTRVFKCVAKLPMKKHNYDRITVREPRRDERRELYEIFTRSAGTQWSNFFGINQDNYLDRVFGSAYVEPISKNLLAKLTAKKSILVAECEGELSAYAIPRMIQPLRIHAALLLFVPLAENFEYVSRALLLKAFNRAFCEGNNKFSFVCIGNENVQNYLDHMGFDVDVNLVPYQYL